MIKEVRLKIHGQVHGVGFRYYTKELAESLGLLGYVKNLPDETLEILAQGEEETLQELLNWCRQGPRLAKVEQVETSWQKPSKTYRNFVINY